MIRTVTGDIETVDGVVYAHEHLILDSPVIEARFPHIHLDDVEAAIREVNACRDNGVALMVDAMPISDGRDVVRLAEISERTGVAIVSATGLHHDRYYGPRHWTNRVTVEQLTELFVADLLEGEDEFDYTGPIVRRTPHRAGLLKVATSGEQPDDRDQRNIEAVAAAHRITGAPVLTHCEGGFGGAQQIERLVGEGVPAKSIILSHVDKAHNLTYLTDLAETGATLELDQALREVDLGRASITIRAVLSLVEHGHAAQIVVGTDGARRSLWTALGGSPGLHWLAGQLPTLLAAEGLDTETIDDIFSRNAQRALTWRTVA